MPSDGLKLICFAVKEEAKPFQARMAGRTDVRVCVTGIGRKNAEEGIAAALGEASPALVITSGFAGGLDPKLEVGTVIFDADDTFPLTSALKSAGAVPVRFHCSPTILTTAESKRSLREQSGADAVEMESGFIRAICAERGIPSATVRVISDAADETLPLDFGALMTPELKLSPLKLAGALAKSPGKIPELMRFGKRVGAAAERLAEVLASVVQ